MDRKTFILSLPFIGAIGKLIAGEKKQSETGIDYSKSTNKYWKYHASIEIDPQQKANGEQLVHLMQKQIKRFNRNMEKEFKKNLYSG